MVSAAAEMPPVFSAAGGRDNSNGYLVDGIEAVDPHYMTPSMFPPMDSMQEFKIQMNSYSAEFGRFAVQVNATTKSGTNALRGSAHEFFRNALLASQYGAGNEPLYKLNANIFQIFVSIWF